MSSSISTKAVLVGLALTFSATSAFAAPLPIGYSTTAPVAPFTPVTTGSGTITDATSPDAYTYDRSHGSLTNTVYTDAGVNYEFYDDYIFTISSATANSVTATINLGTVFALGNMQARIYDWSLNSSVPVYGNPVGPVITSTTTTVNNVTFLAIDDVLLSAGTYVLEVRGAVTGTIGGGYSGVLNVAPVPVPAAFWLMGSALVGLGAIGRKRGH